MRLGLVENFMQIQKRAAGYTAIISILLTLVLGTTGCVNETKVQEAQSSAQITSSVPAVTSPTTATITKTTDVNSITTAVSNTSATSAPTPALVNPAQTNWLKAIPCKAPCWENITPGKTNGDQAVDLLNKNPAFEKLDVSDPTKPDTKPVAIYWRFSGLNSANSNGYITYHKLPQPQVEVIQVTSLNYRLKDITNLYGSPSHVVARLELDGRGSTLLGYNLYIIYLNNGLMLVNKYKTMPVIDPDLYFTETYFFEPSNDGFAKIFEPNRSQRLIDFMVKWQGFQDYKFYCRVTMQVGLDNCDKFLNSRGL